MQKTDTYAKLEWHDGMPYSAMFNDVYFSSDDGLLETEYVFIEGNELASRWQSLDAGTFSIMETGFGTGLNFLCAANCWLKHAPPDATLYFTSVEKYPLSPEDIGKALSRWPALHSISGELLTQYESLLKTGTIALFNGRIKLNVLVGDATSCLSQLSRKTDAWFLDGFAPAKNQDMWQTALFAQMARLSHDKTSFATFTSAGAVRRGLLAAGFSVVKRAGFGKKREMLCGYYSGTDSHG